MPSESLQISVDDAQNNEDTSTYYYGFVNTPAECITGVGLSMPYTHNAPFTISTEIYNGKYMCVTASDKFGNSGYIVSTNPIMIDNTPPTVTLVGNSAITHTVLTPWTDPGANRVDSVDGNGFINTPNNGIVDANTT